MKVNICIIGCGGTGGNLIARLARFLSGDTGNLVINVAIADGDTVEYKNMDRQPFDGEDLGENKAVILAENIESCLHVKLDSYPHYILTTADLDRIFESLNREGDYISGSSSDINILVSCVDNHAARKICHNWFEKVSFLGTTFFIDPANDICFAFIAGIIMCRENAHQVPGGITYFHAFKMFQRFYVCEYDEEEQGYVRES